MTDGRKDSVNSGDAARDPRLDRLYREAAREEPPAHLDAAILAAAHREAGARPRPLSARLRTWRVPVSIAAVVMLSVSLVTLVREEGGDQLMQPAQRDRQSTLERPATAEQSSPRPQTAPVPEVKKSPATEQAPAAAPREDRALGVTASDTGRRQSEAPARKQAAESQGSPPAAERPEPQPFASVAPERAGPPTAPDATTSADAAARSASRPGTREELAAPALPAPRPAPTPGSEALMRDTAPMGEAAGAASGAPRPPAAAAPAEKPRQRVEMRAALKEGRPATDTAYLAGLMKELDAQPPEKWLEKIESLRHEGRPAEADEMLAEFKRRYPTHPLPPGLR